MSGAGLGDQTLAALIQVIAERDTARFQRDGWAGTVADLRTKLAGKEQELQALRSRDDANRRQWRDFLNRLGVDPDCDAPLLMAAQDIARERNEMRAELDRCEAALARVGRLTSTADGLYDRRREETVTVGDLLAALDVKEDDRG